MPQQTRSTYDDVAWRSLLQSTLIHWIENPNDLEDEGLDAPSPQILEKALRVAERMRNEGFPQPTEIVRDPNGGIVFERNLPDESLVVHLWDDGAIERMRFQGSSLIERESIFSDLEGT